MRSKGRNNKLPPFVPLTWSALNHKAYKELPPSSAKALPYFLGKVKCGYNDPEKYTTNFSFSYPEAQNLGFAFGTFADVIKNLVSFGFIDPVAKGGLRGKGRGYNLFSLSRRWEQYGTSEFQSVSWVQFCGKHKRNSKN